MSLFETKPKPVAPQVSEANDIAAIIQRRRYQILVHSLIYYELDTNLVPDSKWAEWSLELVSLQKKHPEIAETVIFADAFKDFDGSTGYHLPFRDEQIINIAFRLLKATHTAEAEDAVRRILSVRATPAEYKGFYNGCPDKAPKRNTQVSRKAVKKNEPVKRKKLF